MEISRRLLGGTLFAAALPGPSMAKAAAIAPAASALVGAWRLVDAVTVLPDGRETDLDGRKGPYEGLIVYSANGMMAVQIASRRQRLDPATPFDRLPDAERLPFLDTYEAYFGRYVVDVAAGIVRHHCETSLDPTGPGLVYQRHFRIDGDMLTIRTSNDANIAHDGHYNRLRWRRA